MNICRVEIEKFRNFRELDITLNDSTVIVGENQVGKSNFLFALRILLDPSLSDKGRTLGLSDFWDGLGTITRNHEIRIAVEFTGFEDNEDLVAILADYLVVPDPMTARITYVLRVRDELEGNPKKDGDFEYIIYGGEAEENQVSHYARRLIPLDLLHALRDAEGDLSNWSRSPLRPSLQRVQAELDRADLEAISSEVEAASKKYRSYPNWIS